RHGGREAFDFQLADEEFGIGRGFLVLVMPCRQMLVFEQIGVFAFVAEGRENARHRFDARRLLAGRAIESTEGGMVVLHMAALSENHAFIAAGVWNALFVLRPKRIEEAGEDGGSVHGESCRRKAMKGYGNPRRGASPLRLPTEMHVGRFARADGDLLLLAAV